MAQIFTDCRKREGVSQWYRAFLRERGSGSGRGQQEQARGCGDPDTRGYGKAESVRLNSMVGSLRMAS